MKSFINKILIVVGLISLVPFFSHAATVSCYPGHGNDLVGKSVNFNAYVNDGAGSSYVYTWDGDDGLDASGQSISHTYSQEGTMTVTVTASSTDSADLITGSCSVGIYTDATLPDFTASCMPNTDSAVIGQNITWSPSINGPLGEYSVTWTSSDSLSGNSYAQTFTYPTAGNKTAQMVSFQSRYGAETPIHNAKLANVDCSAQVNVVDESIHNPTSLVVTGTCSASPASVNTNTSVTWNSNIVITGGTAPYLLTWTDTLGSMGSGSTTSKTYSTAGTKNAYLTVEDNAGQSTDITCANLTVNTPSGGNSHGGSSYTEGDTGTSTATSTATSTSGTATSTATSTAVTATSTIASSTNPVSTSTPNYTGNNNSNGTSTGSNSDYTVSDNYVFTNNQNPGNYSQDIANLQNILTEYGYYNGLIGGYFGPATEKALIAYQSANGLEVTGILDDATRAKLNGTFDFGNDSATTSTSTGNDTPSKISNLGASVLSILDSTINTLGGKITIALYSILVIVFTSLIYYWLKMLRKKD